MRSTGRARPTLFKAMRGTRRARPAIATDQAAAVAAIVVPGTGPLPAVRNDGAFVGHYVAELLAE